MIIVEGMDSSGKSTLIYTLADHLSAWVLKSHNKRPTPLNILDFHHRATSSPHTMICDRHPAISDLIYGNVLRNSSKSTLELAKKCREDCFLIYCRPPTEILLGQIDEKDQMEGVVSHATPLLKYYDQVMSHLSPDFIYDFTQPNQPQLEKLYESISDFRPSAGTDQ